MTASLILLAASVAVSFADGRWNPAEFLPAKCARHDYMGEFVQLRDCISNRCPEGMSPDRVYKDREVNRSVYAVLLHTNRFTIGTTVSSRMGWDWRMAPIITIANELGKDAKGRTELREHWEVCLYDEGINLWHHFYRDGRQTWFKAAALQLPPGMTFAANKPHELKVVIGRDGKGNKCLDAECEGYRLYHQDPALPEEFYLGLNGCEGRNFFWDFKAETK